MTLSSDLHTKQTSAIEIAFVHHPDAVNITASNECVTRVCGPFPGERSNDNFGETSNVGLNSSRKRPLKNTGDNSLSSWRHLASFPRRCRLSSTVEFSRTALSCVPIARCADRSLCSWPSPFRKPLSFTKQLPSLVAF